MEQNMTEQRSTKQNNIEQDSIKHNNITQGSTKQGSAEQNITKHEISMLELIALIKDSEEDFLISIYLGEEADSDAEEGQIQG
ncbi:MAG: hypothetical protein WBI07_12045 [Mobilitalea sp.]